MIEKYYGHNRIMMLQLQGAEPTVVAIRGVVSRYPVAPLAPEQMLGGRVNIYHFAWHINITYNI